MNNNNHILWVSLTGLSLLAGETRIIEAKIAALIIIISWTSFLSFSHIITIAVKKNAVLRPVKQNVK